MSKIDRATLESLTAAFKGPITKVPPAEPVKIKRRRKAPDGRLEQATMRVGEDVAERADYDVASGPGDHVHRAFQMPTDKRSRAYIEMEIAAAESDGDDFSSGIGRRDEYEIRFRTAAQTGTTCGECGRVLAADESVWRTRRKYDSEKVEIAYDSGHRIYETEEIVAPICGLCWDLYDRPRVSHHDPCTGCGRMVHLTPGALDAYLRHGLRVCCCEACTKRKCEKCGERFEPTRQDAKFCSAKCRISSHRKK